MLARANGPSGGVVETVEIVHKKGGGWHCIIPRRFETLRSSDRIRYGAVVVKGGRCGGSVAARVRQGGIHVDVSRAQWGPIIFSVSLSVSSSPSPAPSSPSTVETFLRAKA